MITSGGSVTEIGSGSRENDLEKLCTSNGAKKFHGVDRLAECQDFQTQTVVVVFHVRPLAGKSGNGSGTVWRGWNERGRCR